MVLFGPCTLHVPAERAAQFADRLISRRSVYVRNENILSSALLRGGGVRILERPIVRIAFFKLSGPWPCLDVGVTMVYSEDSARASLQLRVAYTCS